MNKIWLFFSHNYNRTVLKEGKIYQTKERGSADEFPGGRRCFGHLRTDVSSKQTRRVLETGSSLPATPYE